MDRRRGGRCRRGRAARRAPPLSDAPACAPSAARPPRRRQGPRRPGRLRRLPAGADRRPAPRRRRGHGSGRPARPAYRRHCLEDGDRPLRRLRELGRPPVGVRGDARLVPHRGRPLGDPGPRLRPDLREGARPRPRLGRPVARGARGRRAGDGLARLRVALVNHTSLVPFSQMQQVLVLNASYEPLNVCTVRRAHVLLYKGKAEVVEHLDQPLRSATGSFVWPHVIRLLHYVRVPRAIQRKISRRALFARDGWRCVYCGTSSGRLTLDHVVPRSKGGESIWENVVTACAPCNLRKGDRTLEQVGMVLKTKPRAPQPVLLIKLAAPRIPEGWTTYLGDLGTATA